MAMQNSDSSSDHDSQSTGDEGMNDHAFPLGDSTVESNIESGSKNEKVEPVVINRETLNDVNRNLAVLLRSLEKSATRARPNISKTKVQRLSDIPKPSTSSARSNTAKVKEHHENDISQPNTSSAGLIIPQIESQHENKDTNAERFVVRLKKGASSKLLGSRRERPGVPGRRFEHWERIKILQYLIDHACINDVGGLKVWQNMIDDNVLPHRTASSMNNHFRKSLIRDIWDYELPKRAVKSFRRIRRRILKTASDS